MAIEGKAGFSGAGGGDDGGLICGWLFRTGGAAEELMLDAATEVLDQLRAQPPARGDFVWLHLNLAHMGAQRWLQRHSGLTPAFHEAVKDPLRSTRIERDENVLIAVMNDVHFNFNYASSEIATLWVSVDRRLVLSARQSPLRSVDRLRLAIKNGEPIASTVELLERLLRAQADVLLDIVRNVTREIDRTEDDLLAGRINATRAVPARAAGYWCACNGCWHLNRRRCSDCSSIRHAGWPKWKCSSCARRRKSFRSLCRT